MSSVQQGTRCPKCGIPMNTACVSGTHVQVDRCEGCKGHWLDPGELALLVKDRAPALELLARGIEIGDKTSFKCPKCKGILFSGTALGLMLETCANCRGLWFDHGELESIIRRTGLRTETPSTQTSTSAPSTELETFIKTGIQKFLIKQQRTWAEVLINWESAHQYRIEAENGDLIGYAAEKRTGTSSLLQRYFLRSHRSFEIGVFDAHGIAVLSLTRPMTFWFTSMKVLDASGNLVGQINRRFSLFQKCYDLKGADGSIFARIASPFWRPWTFPLKGTRAVIRKRWAGLFQEAFSEADRFTVDLGGHSWRTDQAALILTAALAIDFDYFEHNRAA